ncbi:MAG: hypothetical protein ACYCYM_01195 [Saccharofermentanales bacterium]
MKSCFRVTGNYKIFIIFIVALSFIAAGCNLNQDNDFPAISYSKTESTVASAGISEDDADISSGTIKIALPFSSECIRYLAYMYVGESSGLFKNSHVDDNGLSVSLSTLDFYDVGLNTVLQITGSRGLTTDDIKMLKAANNLPDIFLVNDNHSIVNGDVTLADLNIPYTDQYINPMNVYPTFFSDAASESTLYTIPLYAAVTMIYANRTLFDSSALKDSSALRSPLSLNTVQTLSQQITDAAAGIYGFMGLQELLAFLPSAISPFPQSYMWNNHSFDFRNPAFTESITILSKFASDKSIVDALTDTQKSALFGNADPRTINKIAFWIDDSDNISEWSSYAKVERYPLPVVDRLSVPMTVYSVCVNADSALLLDSIRLAAYISLDNDALLFRSRYNINEGYIPPLRDQKVWDNLVAPQKQGNELLILRSVMENSHAINGNSFSKVTQVYDSLYENYFHGIIVENKSLIENLPNIEAEATSLLSGG